MTKFNLTAAADLFPGVGVLTDGNDLIYGFEGNDTIEGGKGRDTLWGDAGDDVLKGGAGHDLLYGGGGVNELWGGSGNDTIIAVYDAQFAALQGGTGIDSLAFITSDTVAAPSVITVTALNNGFVVSLDGRLVQANSFEQLYVESATALGFTGASEADEVVSTAGHSRILTGAGDDKVFLTRSVSAKGLADTLDGGAGNDLLQLDTTKLDSWMNVSFDATGKGKIAMAFGVNSSFVGFERVEFIGGAKVDKILFTGQAVQLYVEEVEGVATDHDVIEGGTLNDFLYGGSGRDTIRGGDGDDMIVGGSGADVLTGGLGADTFAFKLGSESAVGVADRIADFTSVAMGGADLIDLGGVMAAAGLTGLTLIGTDVFSAAGQVRLVDLGADLAVDINLTGITGAEMRIVLTGVADVSMISVEDFSI